MTIQEYIEQKFQTFGIELSGADILDISLEVALALTRISLRIIAHL